MSTDAPAAISSGTEHPLPPLERGAAGDAAGEATERPAALASQGSARAPSLLDLDRGLREGRAPQAMLAALVAWTITVAPAAFSRSAPSSASVAAVLAVLCGVGAPPLSARRRRVARHVGISLFLAFATLAWMLASPAIQPTRLDPVRAAIGAVAWGVFALSWRDRWPTRQQAAPDPDAPVLQARARLPPLAVPIVTVGTVAGLILLVLAWRIRDSDRALFAQATAVTCAVALISVASGVAVSRGRAQTASSRRLTQHAVRPVLVLIVFAVLGAIVMALR